MDDKSSIKREIQSLMKKENEVVNLSSDKPLLMGILNEAKITVDNPEQKKIDNSNYDRDYDKFDRDYNKFDRDYDKFDRDYNRFDREGLF